MEIAALVRGKNVDLKTSYKSKFILIEIHTSSESWIIKSSIDVWFVITILAEIQLFENMEYEGAEKNIYVYWENHL